MVIDDRRCVHHDERRHVAGGGGEDCVEDDHPPGRVEDGGVGEEEEEGVQEEASVDADVNVAGVEEEADIGKRTADHVEDVELEDEESAEPAILEVDGGLNGEEDTGEDEEGHDEDSHDVNTHELDLVQDSGLIDDRRVLHGGRQGVSVEGGRGGSLGEESLGGIGGGVGLDVLGEVEGGELGATHEDVNDHTEDGDDGRQGEEDDGTVAVALLVGRECVLGDATRDGHSDTRPTIARHESLGIDSREHRAKSEESRLEDSIDGTDCQEDDQGNIESCVVGKKDHGDGEHNDEDGVHEERDINTGRVGEPLLKMHHHQLHERRSNRDRHRSIELKVAVRPSNVIVIGTSHDGVIGEEDTSTQGDHTQVYKRHFIHRRFGRRGVRLGDFYTISVIRSHFHVL